MTNRSFVSSLALAALAMGVASGCGEQAPPPANNPPIRKHSESLVSTTMPSATGGYTQAIHAQITFDKANLFNREFIYSLDLQYSSQFDDGMNLYNQSEAAAHVIVTFRKMGNELQVVTDNKLKFPSDNNHPEEVIARFKILAETDTSLEVSEMDASPYLASQLGPIDDSSKTVTYLDHWVRSFDFDAKDSTLLQQSSLELGDGKTVVEFMESIFPRTAIAPGANFEKFEMDPEDAVGADDGVVARFRFLPSDPIITHDRSGEKKLAFAQHFDISPKADGTPGTIDWYVTPNIPDDYLTPVKQAVEGWNRYFVKMKGIERPVMRFMGKLPNGVYIGDPRYNVINWDSRLIAGAAYETQSSDPETGKQSHSLIYMPAAWLKIGGDYWVKGIASDEMASGARETAQKARDFLNGKLDAKASLDPAALDATMKDALTRPTASTRISAGLKCARDLRDGINLMASGRLMDDELKSFGVQLLKQTLFHEVGHALGFAHNFAGSLSYDPADTKTPFSTSIMDYNDYELERAAFYKVDGSDGPLLEYDRQTLSAIYNKGQDVAATDPVLPACNDAEADNEAGGVNPLCTRYDVQKDPTESIVTATQRVENEKVDARDVSLAEALGRVPALALPDAKLTTALSEDDVIVLASRLAVTLRGSLDFYLNSDVSALTRTVKTNLKSLYEFGGELPSGYDTAAMRERVFAGVQKVIGLTELPATPKAALAAAIDAGVARIAKATFMLGLDDANRARATATLKKLVTASVTRYMTDAASGMPAARAKLLLALARHPKVDFFLGKEGTAAVDYENNVVGLLAGIVGDQTRSGIERVAAASALKSFKTRLVGGTAIAGLSKKLSDERAAVSSNDQRRVIEALFQVLGL